MNPKEKKSVCQNDMSTTVLNTKLFMKDKKWNQSILYSRILFNLISRRKFCHFQQR